MRGPRKNRESWRELVVVLGTAAVVAVGLWVVGLSEVAWGPFFFAAVESGRRDGWLSLPSRGVRS